PGVHDCSPDHRPGPSERTTRSPPRTRGGRRRGTPPRGPLRERVVRLSSLGARRRHRRPRRVLPGDGRRRPARAGAAEVLRPRPRRLHPAVADRPVTLAGVTSRRWSTITVLVAGIAFVAVAAIYIPWHPVPGGTPSPVLASEVFTPAQIARANAYSDPARYLGWASLAVSLVVALFLGLTPVGRRLVARLPGWWWVRVLLAVAALAVVGRLATLPFAIIGHHRAVAYGLSDEAWGPRAGDL